MLPAAQQPSVKPEHCGITSDRFHTPKLFTPVFNHGVLPCSSSLRECWKDGSSVSFSARSSGKYFSLSISSCAFGVQENDSDESQVDTKKIWTCSASKRLQVSSKCKYSLSGKKKAGRGGVGECQSCSHFKSIFRSSRHAQDGRLNVTGRIYPVQVLLSQQSLAAHHSRSEVPFPLWVDRLFEALSVVSSAEVRTRQLLVPARDTQPLKGAEQHTGAVRGAESRHIRHYHKVTMDSQRHRRRIRHTEWLHLISATAASVRTLCDVNNCLHTAVQHINCKTISVGTLRFKEDKMIN